MSGATAPGRGRQVVGWWLGALWTGLAWSVLLLPYPFPDLIRSLLADLPSVMTLAPPG